MRGGAVFWTVRRGATGSRRGVAVKAATAARSAKRASAREHIVDDSARDIVVENVIVAASLASAIGLWQ